MADNSKIRQLVAKEIMNALRIGDGNRRIDVLSLEDNSGKESSKSLRGVFDRTKKLSQKQPASVSVKKMIELLRFVKNDSIKSKALFKIEKIQSGLSVEDDQIDVRLIQDYPNTLQFLKGKEAEENTYFGPLIVIWSGINRENPNLNLGIKSDNITIVDTEKEFIIPKDADLPIKPKSGRDLTKFCLTDISPPDFRDSLGGEIRLEVERTCYSQIFKCEPYFHRENVRAALNEALPSNIKLLSENDLFDNRMAFGSLDPNANKIPRSLTLMYTLVTSDDYVMLMKRSKTVDYYPETIDLSGGEQLDESDFDDSSNVSVFNKWAKRTVIEEWFPSVNLDSKILRWLENEVSITTYLQAIAYNELDGNYPVMALIKLNLTLAELKVKSEQVIKQSNYTARYEGEGTRCAALISSMKKQILSNDPIEYTRLTVGSVSSERGSFCLNRKELHPSTPLRIHLLMTSL